MASRKKKTQNDSSRNSNHDSNASRTTIIISVIGLIGTLGVAIIGYLSSRTQVELPISATQTAEAKPVVENTPTSSVVQSLKFTDLNKPIDKNGEITHHLDSGYQTFAAGVNRADFMAEAEFVVPYNDHPWVDVVGFRSVARVWIKRLNTGAESGFGYFDTDGKWKEQTYPLPGGLVTIQEGDKNSIRVIAYGNLGCLYVNNKNIAELSLPNPILSDDVRVGISEQEFKIENAVTRYENFSTYSVDEPITSCPNL